MRHGKKNLSERRRKAMNKKIVGFGVFVTSVWVTTFLLSLYNHNDWQLFPITVTGFIVAMIGMSHAWGDE